MLASTSIFETHNVPILSQCERRPPRTWNSNVCTEDESLARRKGNNRTNKIRDEVAVQLSRPDTSFVSLSQALGVQLQCFSLKRKCDTNADMVQLLLVVCFFCFLNSVLIPFVSSRVIHRVRAQKLCGPSGTFSKTV